MNTNKKNLLLAIAAIVLMVGSGALLERTVNGFHYTSSALAVISVSLLAVFIYILGVPLIGRSLQRERTRRPYGGFNSGLQFAFLLIAGGLLLLCFNTELLNPVWKRLFFSWPMLLFVLGAIHVCRSRFTSGIIACAAGYFFLMEKAARIYPGNLAFKQFVATYWPGLIILAGILILLRILAAPGRFHRRGNRETPDENVNSNGKINYRFIFSGTEQVILDPVFRGGTIEVTFGGLELDLRRTSLAAGDTFLYVKALFGGVEITAPGHWEIEIHSKGGFAGGVCDSRAKNVDKDPAGKLIVIATSTFGGIEIK
ncbi:MAG: cell wall-active antibiotics response protein [Tannerella sp.]|jgi:predicted membrane protein|nr:cell wall-active antibiotics response protein [Tannerella sp.]